MKKIYELIFVDHKIKINGQFYYYYAAFNAPCVGHKDDESQAQCNRGFSFLADAASLPTIKHAICLSFKKTTLHLIVPKTLATYSKNA